MNPCPKVCSCEREYDAEAWRLLDLLGTQEGDGEDDTLELRLCAACRTTLAIELPRDPRTIHFSASIVYAPRCPCCQSDKHTRFVRFAAPGRMEWRCDHCDYTSTLTPQEEHAAREPERLRARLEELKATCAPPAARSA